MHRCAFLPPALLTAALLLAAAPVAAQMQRPFPAHALRGELRITQPPEALLNGRAARLAPGARIRDQRNLGVLSGTLVGQTLLVHYTLDTQGLVHEVWVLTPAERARQPWPTTAAQAQAWTFNPAAQTWSRP